MPSKLFQRTASNMESGSFEKETENGDGTAIRSLARPSLSDSTGLSTASRTVTHRLDPHSEQLPLADGSGTAASAAAQPPNPDTVKGHTHSPMARSLWRYARYLLQFVVVLLWYTTNGMNGIAMQSYAYSFLTIGVDGNTQSEQPHALIVWSNASLVTALQLLTGAFLGRILLLLSSPDISWREVASTHSLPLSVVHGFGNLSTNLGYMYGKASIIQVLKLLEPFETLVLSFFLFSEINCSMGVISSMSVVVGASMSLLKQQAQKDHIPIAAVVYALISGFTLSSRNVLQRRHGQVAMATTHTTHGNSMTPTTATESSIASQQDAKRTGLDKALIQFTQMSYFAGLELAAFTVIQYVTLSLSLPLFSPSSSSLSTQSILQFQHLSVPLAIWHPLFNAFSTIALGFYSALTHSLWNAGKRVFAVLLAMLWFHEGLNIVAVFRLSVIGAGALWYSTESKKAKTTPATVAVPSVDGTELSHPFVATLLLCSVFFVAD